MAASVTERAPIITRSADGSANFRSANETTVYDVEHLATFSTGSSHEAPKQSTTQLTSPNETEISKSRECDSANTNETTKPATLTAPRNGIDIGNRIHEPRVALQKLFELEKLSGIWTQRMQIELQSKLMLIVDCETNAVVEKFSKNQVTKPEAFSQYNNIYNNIIVFVIKQQKQQQSEDSASDQDKQRLDDGSAQAGELHIFQCVSHKAQQLVSDILTWKRDGKTNPECGAKESGESRVESRPSMATNQDGGSKARMQNERQTDGDQDAKSAAQPGKSDKIKASEQQQNASALNNSAASRSKPPVVVTAAAGKASSRSSDHAPIVNVNVKETVQVFNQIAALREKSIPTSPTNHARPLSELSIGSAGNATDDQSNVRQAAATDGSVAQLSQGAQLYKQRSIRASLAPGANSPPGSTADKLGGTAASKPTTTTGSSSGSSQPVSRRAQQKVASSANAKAGGQTQPAASQQRARPDDELEPPTRLLFDDAEQGRAARPKDQHHQDGSRQQGAAGAADLSAKSAGNASRQAPRNNSPQQLADQVATNESYVSVLNHCFDDIEKFIIRLQQAFNAARELQHHQRQLRRPAPAPTGSASSSHSKRSSAVAATNSASSSASSASSSSLLAGGKQQQQLPPIPAGATSQAKLAALAQCARGPSADDYFEILSKFKLAFNLLAKLKGCIHEPNAPELVHFLFTPLAIIIESARNVSPPVDPTLVGIPYLNRDALELLSNCCTSKESDLWLSLGSNWAQTIDLGLLSAARLPSSFQPVFSDGWAPVISELELIGLPSPALLLSSIEASQPAEPPIYRKCSSMQPTNGERRAAVDLRHVSPSADFAPDGAPVYAEQLALSARGQRGATGAPRTRRTDHLSPHRGHYHSQAALHHPAHTFANGQHNQSNSSDDYTELQDIERLPLERSARHALGAKPAVHGHDYAPRHYRSSEQVSGAAYGRPVTQAPHASSAHRRRPQADMDGSQRRVQHVQRPRRHMAPGDKHALSADVPYDMDDEQYLVYQHRADPYSEQHPAALLAERDAMLLDLGPAQTEWFYELQARGALTVRVLFTRDANNDKELSVRRGELLEVLDDSRKWWKARNIDLQVAHVPHTIVAVMNHYQTLDELLTNTDDSFGAPVNGNVALMQQHQLVHGARLVASRRNELAAATGQFRPMLMTSEPNSHAHDERRGSSKAAGAFRYF